MKIEFAPITSFQQCTSAALVLELSAVLSGVGLLEDIQPDLALLLDEMRANPHDFDLEEEVEFLEEEGFAAENLAREKLVLKVSSILGEREETFGSAYPFVFGDGDGVVVNLKPVEHIGPAGLAVIALSLFTVLEDRDLAQISKDDRTKFSKLFEPVFEVVCALALVADNEGVVWWNGRSRSRRTFLRQLNLIRDFVGSGQVRTEGQLQANQVGVNDGGVDAFGIATVQGVVGPDSNCVLLGATLQRSSRRTKIVGPAELQRLDDFFFNRPNLTFTGMLAIPFNRSEAEAQDCSAEKCRYFPIEAIFRNLSLVAEKNLVPIAEPYVTRLGRHLVSKSRKLAAQLAITINGQVRQFPQP